MIESMPDNFFPDELIVIGRYKNFELAFAITPSSFLDVRNPGDLLVMQVNALREQIWKSQRDLDATLPSK